MYYCLPDMFPLLTLFFFIYTNNQYRRRAAAQSMFTILQEDICFQHTSSHLMSIILVVILTMQTTQTTMLGLHYSNVLALMVVNPISTCNTKGNINVHIARTIFARHVHFYQMLMYPKDLRVNWASLSTTKMSMQQQIYYA